MFIRFDATHERDGHTQTPHDDISRACIASRGKNDTVVAYCCELHPTASKPNLELLIKSYFRILDI